MIRRDRIEISSSLVHIIYIGDCIKNFYKNDLPGYQSSYKDNNNYMIYKWFTNKGPDRSDDLPAYLSIIHITNIIIEYTKYSDSYRYKGYSRFEIHSYSYSKIYNFIHGVCLKFLKEELESDD